MCSQADDPTQHRAARIALQIEHDVKGAARPAAPALDDAAVAAMFHETYERLAPSFGYETRPESAVPWADVPEQNRALMAAVVHEVRAALAASATDDPGLADIAGHSCSQCRWVASRPDDRYRINQTTTAILASFHEVAEDYGLRLAGDEQVAICRRLADRLKARSGPLSRSDVLWAFEDIGVRRPPNGFWRALRDRLERVVG